MWIFELTEYKNAPNYCTVWVYMYQLGHNDALSNALPPMFGRKIYAFARKKSSGYIEMLYFSRNSFLFYIFSTCSQELVYQLKRKDRKITYLWCLCFVSRLRSFFPFFLLLLHRKIELVRNEWTTTKKYSQRGWSVVPVNRSENKIGTERKNDVLLVYHSIIICSCIYTNYNDGDDASQCDVSVFTPFLLGYYGM